MYGGNLFYPFDVPQHRTMEKWAIVVVPTRLPNDTGFYMTQMNQEDFNPPAQSDLGSAGSSNNTKSTSAGSRVSQTSENQRYYDNRLKSVITGAEANQAFDLIRLWGIRPPTVAGPTSTGLGGVPHGKDTTKQSLMKDNTITTWNITSHAYIIEVRYKEADGLARNGEGAIIKPQPVPFVLNKEPVYGGTGHTLGVVRPCAVSGPMTVDKIPTYAVGDGSSSVNAMASFMPVLTEDTIKTVACFWKSSPTEAPKSVDWNSDEGKNAIKNILSGKLYIAYSLRLTDPPQVYRTICDTPEYWKYRRWGPPNHPWFLGDLSSEWVPNEFDRVVNIAPETITILYKTPAKDWSDALDEELLDVTGEKDRRHTPPGTRWKGNILCKETKRESFRFDKNTNTVCTALKPLPPDHPGLENVELRLGESILIEDNSLGDTGVRLVSPEQLKSERMIKKGNFLDDSGVEWELTPHAQCAVAKLGTEDHEWKLLTQLELPAGWNGLGMVSTNRPNIPKPSKFPEPEGGVPTTVTVKYVPTYRVNPTRARSIFDQPAGPVATKLMNNIVSRLDTSEMVTAVNTLMKGVVFRDGAATAGIADTVRTGTDNWREEAVFVRLLLWINARSRDIATNDSTCFKALRRIKSLSIDTDNPIRITPRGEGENKSYTNITSNIAIVPLDVALTIATNKIQGHNLGPTWAYGKLDITWTMVPITSAQIASSYIIPFIAAHMDTRLTYGRTTWEYGYAADGCHNQRITTIPVSSTVELPDVLNIMLVLVDCVEQYVPTSMPVGTSALLAEVPVYRRNADAIYAGTNFLPAFDEWWQGDSANLLSDIHGAITWASKLYENDSTCGMALSSAAELSNKLYLGMLATYNAQNVMNVNLDGAWCLGNNQPIFEDSFFTGRRFTDPVRTAVNGQDTITGFNFSGLSPYHLMPSSGASCTIEQELPAGYQKIWVGEPKGNIPMEVTTTSSCIRLAYGLGLLETTIPVDVYERPEGIGSHVTMVASGLAMSTAALLATSDISLREWTGMDPSGTVRTADSMLVLKCASLGRLTRIRMKQYFRPAGAQLWVTDGLRTINEYYTSLDNNLIDDCYLSFSPVPSAATLQWMKKFDVWSGVPSTTKYEIITIARQQLCGVNVRGHAPVNKVQIVASNDIRLGNHRVVFASLSTTSETLKLWVDTFDMVTTHPASYINEPGISKPTVSTATFVRDIVDRTQSDNEPCHLIRTSNFVREWWQQPTDIEYPDPPTPFMTQVSRWLVLPTAGAIIGGLSAGPLGAAVGAGAEILDNVLADARRVDANRHAPNVAPQ